MRGIQEQLVHRAKTTPEQPYLSQPIDRQRHTDDIATLLYTSGSTRTSRIKRDAIECQYAELIERCSATISFET